MSIVAALDKVLFFNASSKYSVLRMKTEDSSVPTEARSPYRYHDHLIRFTAVGIELPQTDTVKIKMDGEWKGSLVGAAPTPYYKAGEALMKHDYEKKLKSPIHDKTVAIRDTYRRQQEHKNSQASIVKYEVGEVICHPKFGEGCIEEIEQGTGSVSLHIRFGEELKVIDQKWLLRTKYRKKE